MDQFQLLGGGNMRPSNILLLNAANIANDQTSAAIVTDFVTSISAQAVLTGSSPNGHLKFQGSNDSVFAPNVPVSWNDIGTTLTITTTGTYLIPAFDVCYAFIRLVWLKNSGSGTITAHSKEVGF